MNLHSHRRRWETCSRCPLHHERTNVVLFRGCYPSPLLFVGEAPGESEDITGRPFMGPAGKLFEQLIDPIEAHVEYGVTNVVACIPRQHNDGQIGTRIPTKKEATACLPRLKEIITLVSPRIVCSLGVTASKWIDEHLESTTKTIHHLKLAHPSSIIRADPTSQPLMFQRFQVTLLHKLKEIGLLDV